MVLTLKVGEGMRLATFNVENMFMRAKAMNLSTWSEGEQILNDFHRLNILIQKDVYTNKIKLELLTIMKRNSGLLTLGVSKYIRLREIRNKLVAKPKNKPALIEPSGRGDWIGWFELEKEDIKDIAVENTARIVGLLQADVLCVIEAENRICLKRFNSDILHPMNIPLFEHIMLIDGNDDRGIDVGVLTAASFDIKKITSHVDDTDDQGIIFSRDCIEHEIKTKKGNTLLLLINHFKSKGYGNSDDSAKKRLRQAKRVREIYEERKADGYEYIAIAGDFNETPDNFPMDPLVRENSDLIDVMVHLKFITDGRAGTHGNGTASSKLDYIFMSPKLSQKVKKCGIERRGVWGGKNGTLFPHLDTMKSVNDAASDHAALWVDLDI